MIMAKTVTVARRMKVYTPPTDGKPRDMVDAKWSSLSKAARQLGVQDKKDKPLAR